MAYNGQEDVFDLAARRTTKRAKSGKGGARRAAPIRRQDQSEFQFMRKQAARRARVRRNRFILLGAVVLIALAAIGIRTALVLGAGSATFYEGITIDTIPLKGLSRQQAVETVTQYNQQRLANTSVKLVFEDREWTIESSKIGVYIDVEEMVEAAWQVGRQGHIFTRQAEITALRRTPKAFNTTLTYDVGLLEQQLALIKAQIDIPAKDATIDFDPSREEMFRTIAEVHGREVPLDGLMRVVISQLDSELSLPITIQAAPVEPEVFAEDIQYATTRIKRITTPLGDSKEERIHNIKLALSKFNGMVIQPGEEISFNQVTGPRGLEQGYKNAGVILDDEIVDGPGGGVCQVSTTMYHAMVRSGVQIVKRFKHSLPVSYVPKGTDAAVAYDYKDLVLKNTSDAPIYLVCGVSGSNVSVEVFGKPLEEGVDIRIVSEVYETIPAPEPDIVTDTLAEYAVYADEMVERKKSREGYRVRAYAVWYKDDQEVKREKLSEDYYQEVKGITYVGVTPRDGVSPVDAGGTGDVPVIGE